MSLFSLKDVCNHPRRSAFDLSSKVAFSAKSGELLPIKWYFTMPGDKFTLKRQHFTRTQPVNTSAYARIVTGKTDRKSTRLNSSHSGESRMPSSA